MKRSFKAYFEFRTFDIRTFLRSHRTNQNFSFGFDSRSERKPKKNSIQFNFWQNVRALQRSEHFLKTMLDSQIRTYRDIDDR